ncbi:hypothetical protein ACFVAD_20560 [Sutcliffiella sp. NPDC057660]|uniref:hypothetical protein n=1 Tax=Sutcliffiella sp. NPDC057660 TaxID=3346199 RepID=UPI0036B55D24
MLKISNAKKGRFIMINVKREYSIRKRTFLLQEEDTLVELISLIKSSYFETDDIQSERIETLLTSSNQIELNSLSALQRKRYEAEIGKIKEINLSKGQANFILNHYNETNLFKLNLEKEIPSSLI